MHGKLFAAMLRFAPLVGAGLLLAGIALSFVSEPALATSSGSPTPEVETRQAVPESSMRVPTSFGLDRVEILRQDLFGYPLWQYVASLTWIVLAFLVSHAVHFVISNRLRALAAKSNTKVDDLVIDAVGTPLKAIAFVLLLAWGMEMFTWPGWAETTIRLVFKVAVGIAITVAAVRLVNVLVLLLQNRIGKTDDAVSRQIWPLIRKSLKVFVLVVASLVVCQNLGVNVTSVVAGLGIGGLAVALAAQDALANLFGSFAILADQPFRMGEFVNIDGKDGSVEEIGLRSTRLRTTSGALLTIPNKTVANAAISNVSRRPTIQQSFTLALSLDTPPEEMQHVVSTLREVFAKHPLTDSAQVYWRDWGNDSLDVSVNYWCRTTDYAKFLEAMQEVNFSIQQRLHAEGIRLVVPTQTFRLDQEEGKSLRVEGLVAQS